MLYVYSYFNSIKLGEIEVTRMFLRRNHARVCVQLILVRTRVFIWRKMKTEPKISSQLCDLFWQWANAAHRVSHNIHRRNFSRHCLNPVRAESKGSHETTKKRNITEHKRRGKNCHVTAVNSENSSIFVIDDGNGYLVIATRSNRRRLSALSREITRRAKRLIIASDCTNDDRKTCFQQPCIVLFARARYSNDATDNINTFMTFLSREIERKLIKF